MTEETRKEWGTFGILAVGFLLFFLIPFTSQEVQAGLLGGFLMVHEYAREHVLFCLIPAFFIAGTISVMVRKDWILKVLGPASKPWISYPVASVSGGILAVCSCTILPLFGGIYKRGAGLGPAIAFLFTGPAINITAILLTGNTIGWDMSMARLVFAVITALIIGPLMQLIFREKGEGGLVYTTGEPELSMGKPLVFLGLQVSFLVFAGAPIPQVAKIPLMLLSGFAALGFVFLFPKPTQAAWIGETWSFTKKIFPFLFAGVFIAGIMTAVLPANWVEAVVGGNRLGSTLVASILGAFMYFATLTEVPIVQSLMELGMGRGPALSLFLAGNALSLPSMIVIVKLLGWKKALTFFGMVVCLATLWGFLYGNLGG